MPLVKIIWNFPKVKAIFCTKPDDSSLWGEAVPAGALSLTVEWVWLHQWGGAGGLSA